MKRYDPDFECSMTECTAGEWVKLEDLPPASTCYALVLYSYDYYEWETTKAVSFDREKLKREHKAQDGIYSDRPLVAFKEHQIYAEREDAHWVIQPVKFLA
jgi:hypothetical protein